MSVLAKLALGGILIFAGAETASAWGGLNGQRLEGFYRYCFYSDGGALSVGSTELCPISNEGAGGQIQMKKSPGFGGLTGQKTKGLNRYCEYSDGSILTVEATDLCPITSN